MAEVNFNNRKSNKEFDRSICFTFFEDYRKTAVSIEKMLGKEAACDYYTGLIDYALYAKEPQFDGMLEIIWPTTKANLDAGIERRKRGFRKEDTQKTQRILDYHSKNPEASQAEIALNTKSSVGKVNKVLQKERASNPTPNANADTLSDTSCEREREQNHVIKDKRRALKELGDEELKSLLGDFQSRVNYSVMYSKYNLEGNCLNKNLKSTIENLLANREAKRQEGILADYLASNPIFKNDLIKKIGCTSQDFDQNVNRLETSPGCLRYYFFDRTTADPMDISFYEANYSNDTMFSDYWDFLKNILFANCIEVNGVWKDKKWN